MRALLLILFSLSIISCDSTSNDLNTENEESNFRQKEFNKYVFGYLPSWHNYRNFNDWDKITHVLISFAHVKTDGTLDLSDIEDKIIPIRDIAQNHGVGVIVSFGGGGAHGWTEALLNQETRDNLTANIIQFSQDYNLQGVDLDFEEWQNGGDINDAPPTPNVTENLEILYRDLKAGLPEDILLTAAIPASNWYLPNYTSSMFEYLDLVGVMNYDNTATYQSSPYGHHASYEDFMRDLNKWKDIKNIPSTKLLGGLPFYGYEFHSKNGGLGTAYTYKDIVAKYPDAEDHINIGMLFYDNPSYIQQKCQYVLDNNFGGVIIWEVMQDISSGNKLINEVEILIH